MLTESWLNDELSAILGFSAQEITDYVMALPADDSARFDYLAEFLDTSDPIHSKFLQNFKLKSAEKAKSPVKNVKKSNISSAADLFGNPQEGLMAYQKEKTPTLETKPIKKVDNVSSHPEVVMSSNMKSSEVKKGKTKYVSLYSNEGSLKDSAVIPGRHKCDCQATKHNLISNCIRCGRIICDQEGSGPCVFCGNLVCTPEEREILDRNSRKSETLMKKLMNPEQEKSLKTAEERKNRLLEFDKNSEKRTSVIDDESDYFSVDNDKWLSKNQREALRKRDQELREKKYGSRLDRKITLDFAGRQVIEEEPGLKEYDPSQDEIVKKIMDMDVNKKKSSGADDVDKVVAMEAEFQAVYNPNISVSRPMWVSDTLSERVKENPNKQTTSSSNSKGLRIQDAQLQEMADDGFCMSMHQPYASLLVAGIKRHEGRTWYSSHRGRLWIHAASKEPTDREIKELHEFYKIVWGRDNLPFPKSYPVSCLLGCVDVKDVKSQEDYRDSFPEGESFSPYVFVCENPKELMLKYPMTGQHKIYKMDSKIHQSVKKLVKKESNV